MARQNYSTLQAKINKEIEKLRKQAQALQSKQRKPVISQIVRSMKEYEISPKRSLRPSLKSAVKQVVRQKHQNFQKMAALKSPWHLNTVTPVRVPPGLAEVKLLFGLSKPRKTDRCVNNF